ncbi:hypothetical protein A2U01_0110102 [Trifolium medium]|uniref:Uncharacterized protein n=1 Tax=Trifolium medium TaxID=97028 RepID=A0A392VKA8_9FABA|nr:hypothetical protein [Trifolium medium]
MLSCSVRSSVTCATRKVSLRGAHHMFVFPACSSGGCDARRVSLRGAQAFGMLVDR